MHSEELGIIICLLMKKKYINMERILNCKIFEEAKFIVKQVFH